MKISIVVRAYEELNSYFPSIHRKRDFILEIEAGTTIKNMIEKMGIPLSQIDMILSNGESVGISHQLQHNDRISIYPVFEIFDITSATKIREIPLRKPRFLCDIHLGKLAKNMRMFGIDTYYQNNISHDRIIKLSIEDNRIILTKNKSLLKNKLVTHGYLVSQFQPDFQMAEVVSYFDLKNHFLPLSRCLKCNFPVYQVSKQEVVKMVPFPILEMHDEFMKCNECKQIYWKGTHYKSMMNWIKRLRS